MELDVLPIGLYEENVYVLHENEHVLIVDPGRYAKEIMKHIDDKEVVDGIVLTHGHDDHTGAVDDLVDVYHCPVYIHKADYGLVKERGTAMSGGSPTPLACAVSTFEEGKCKVGIFALEIIHTPGHTAGSCLIRYQQYLFTGDTLFAGDIGRTDLYSGDMATMIESLKRIRTLEQSWLVYPGHEESSTMRQEILLNPYLQDAFLNRV